MAPSDDLLGRKEPPTGIKHVPRLDEMESKELVEDGDGLESENRAETVILGQKLKDIARTEDIAQQGHPKKMFGALETPEKTDNKLDSAVMK